RTSATTGPPPVPARPLRVELSGSRRRAQAPPCREASSVGKAGSRRESGQRSICRPLAFAILTSGRSGRHLLTCAARAAGWQPGLPDAMFRSAVVRPIPAGTADGLRSVTIRGRVSAVGGVDSPYWNVKTETLPREDLQRLQVAKLRYLAGWAAARSPHYR